MLLGFIKDHPDIKRTLVAMSVRTGMTVSQVSDEVLYTGLIEIQELEAPGYAQGGTLGQIEVWLVMMIIIMEIDHI